MMVQKKMAHCFVTRDDFPEWVRVNADMSPDADYDLWLKQLDDFCKTVASQGGNVVKVHANPAEFAAWCQDEGIEINANARSRYCAIKLAEHNRTAHHQN